jgi:hypothetical protein
MKKIDVAVIRAARLMSIRTSPDSWAQSSRDSHFSRHHGHGDMQRCCGAIAAPHEPGLADVGVCPNVRFAPILLQKSKIERPRKSRER